MCAVAQKPCVVVLVVDRAETARIGDQVIGEDPADHGHHHRQQLPRPPVVGAPFVVEGLAHGVDRIVDHPVERGLCGVRIGEREQSGHRGTLDRVDPSGHRCRVSGCGQFQPDRRCAALRLRKVEHQSHGAAGELEHRHLPAGGIRFAGDPVVASESSQPHQPVAAEPIGQSQIVAGNQRLIPGFDRRGGIGCGAVDFGVALAEYPERVLVVSEPNMQPVFFDASVWAAAGCTLPAEPPATLVDGDGVEAIAPARFAQSPGGAQPGHATAEDGDLASRPAHPSSVRARTRSGQSLSAGNLLIASVKAALDDSPCSSKSSISGAQFEDRCVLLAGDIDGCPQVCIACVGVFGGAGPQPQQLRAVEVHAGLFAQLQCNVQTFASLVGFACCGEQLCEYRVVERHEQRRLRCAPALDDEGQGPDVSL